MQWSGAGCGDCGRQAVDRAVMNQSRTVRLPIHVIRGLTAYLWAIRNLEQKFGRCPNMEEISNEVGISKEQANKMFVGHDQITVAGDLKLKFRCLMSSTELAPGWPGLQKQGYR